MLTRLNLVQGSGLIVATSIAASTCGQEDLAERESLVVAPAPGTQRLRMSDFAGDVDNREASAVVPDELVKVTANDRVLVEYRGPRKLVGKRPVYTLKAVIEQEKTENCKTKITRQPYEPEYHDEPTLVLGRQLKITVVLLSPTKEVIDERKLLADGTLEGGPLEIAESGYITVRYRYPAEDVCFATRPLNAKEIKTFIQPKLQELAQLPNYKITGDGYVGEVRAGDMKKAKVYLSVVRTR